MTRYQQLLNAIMASPEDDAPRRALAELVRESEPDLARFVACQLETAILRRAKRYRTDSRSHEADALLKHNWDRWTRDVGFYMGELAAQQYVEFDRGFPSSRDSGRRVATAAFSALDELSRIHATAERCGR